ncbi:MAG: glycosyltransferase [Cyanobacteria bacterium]|nr:glycosyltransferase [Cyanobacteriota bacterium]
MTLLLGVPVYRRYDLLAKLIKSALAGTMVPDRIVVVDNGCSFNAQYRGPMERVEVIRHGTNEGCAAGWNRILKAATDSKDEIILANDDIVLRCDGIEIMIRQLRSDNGKSVVRGHGFSLFCLSQQTWRRVGMFDERFWPAYLEDKDYKYRLSLASVPLPPKVAAASRHSSSASLNTFSPLERIQFNLRYTLNRLYYVSKWGAIPGRERHKNHSSPSRNDAISIWRNATRSLCRPSATSTSMSPCYAIWPPRSNT